MKSFKFILLAAALTFISATASIMAGIVTGGPYSDGTGTNAKFISPQGLAVDAYGNVYVGDATHNMIRKITSTGNVTRVAGSLVAGSADGSALQASFRSPTGIAIDTLLNLYVADNNNYKVRRISSSFGKVVTLAGSGLLGCVDGIGSTVKFYDPTGVAVDLNGVVYVTDSSAHVVRMISTTGLVTTLAGKFNVGTPKDGVGTAAQFKYPWGITIDSAGFIYVAEYYAVRKLTSAGDVQTLFGSLSAGGNSDGYGTTARFNVNQGIALDPVGNFYVVSMVNQVVNKISPQGLVTTFAGSGKNPIDGGCPGYTYIDTNSYSSNKLSLSAPLCNCHGVAVDTAGSLYVSSAWNEVYKVSTYGT